MKLSSAACRHAYQLQAIPNSNTNLPELHLAAARSPGPCLVAPRNALHRGDGAAFDLLETHPQIELQQLLVRSNRSGPGAVPGAADGAVVGVGESVIGFSTRSRREPDLPGRKTSSSPIAGQ